MVFRNSTTCIGMLYDLLNEARLSWHQTQAANPKRDEAQVLQKRAEIKKNGSLVICVAGYQPPCY